MAAFEADYPRAQDVEVTDEWTIPLHPVDQENIAQVKCLKAWAVYAMKSVGMGEATCPLIATLSNVPDGLTSYSGSVLTTLVLWGVSERGRELYESILGQTYLGEDHHPGNAEVAVATWAIENQIGRYGEYRMLSGILGCEPLSQLHSDLADLFMCQFLAQDEGRAFYGFVYKELRWPSPWRIPPLRPSDFENL
ncbi:MAG: hypothetical protein JWN37_189 [Candidatus Nomurabacteria bacterium]|nr:hypothetical protein [Candidatus Nomurabacteria bacterium]